MKDLTSHCQYLLSRIAVKLRLTGKSCLTAQFCLNCIHFWFARSDEILKLRTLTTQEIFPLFFFNSVVFFPQDRSVFYHVFHQTSPFPAFHHFAPSVACSLKALVITLMVISLVFYLFYASNLLVNGVITSISIVFSLHKDSEGILSAITYKPFHEIFVHKAFRIPQSPCVIPEHTLMTSF